jgi:hypothetical protein
MTAAAIERIIQLALNDPEFREQLETAPHAALAGFDLTQAERDLMATRSQRGLAAVLGPDSSIHFFGLILPHPDPSMM